MNNGFAQGRNQTINLPRGGYMMAPQMIGGYGGHDPYLQGAAGNPYTMGAAGSLGVGPSMSGGGYGFGSGPMTLGGGMGDSTQAAYNQARNANLDLESELKGGFQSRYDRGMAMVNSMGKTVDSDINRIFDERAAKLRRQFNPGMSTNQSTVMARVGAQNERERSDALSRAYDTLTARKLETDARLSGDALSQRERVTNAYPDIAAQAAMAGKAGEAQAPMPNYEQPQPGGGYGMPEPMIGNGFGGPAGNDQMDMRQASYAAKKAGYNSVAAWKNAGGANAPQRMTNVQKTQAGIKQAKAMGSGIGRLAGGAMGAIPSIAAMGALFPPMASGATAPAASNSIPQVQMPSAYFNAPSRSKPLGVPVARLTYAPTPPAAPVPVPSYEQLATNLKELHNEFDRSASQRKTETRRKSKLSFMANPFGHAASYGITR